MTHTHDDNGEDRFRFVEERVGLGSVRSAGVSYEGVKYAVSRFQGMTRAGLPVPGVHRLEGRLEFTDGLPETIVGSRLELSLEDGSSMSLELLDADGRVVAHGHGPGRCMCC